MKPPPLNKDWLIMQCRVCLEPWDEWHQSRENHILWFTCHWDRRIQTFIKRFKRKEKDYAKQLARDLE